MANHKEDAHEHVHGGSCSHAHAGPQPVRNLGPKVGRNDPCSCGSGRKFKVCCGKAVPA